MKKNNQKGVTLIALTVTIGVLLILAGITVATGIDSVKKANLEGLKTNMMLIETKAREYVENASFDLGVNPQNATEEMRANAKNELTGIDKGEQVTATDNIKSQLINIGISEADINNGNVYKLTTDNLKNMGIKDVESNNEEGWYIIVYNINETTAEIYHTVGFQEKHSLTEIEQMEI